MLNEARIEWPSAKLAYAACLMSLVAVAACGDSEDSGRLDQAFLDGFEAGYAEGLADAQAAVGTGGVGGAPGDGGVGGAPGTGGTAQTLSLEEIALNVGSSHGLLMPLYRCESDAGCLKGEVCWEDGGFCGPPPACEMPHPDSSAAECQRLCFSRYDVTNRYIPCMANCRCEPHIGDEVACDGESQCRLPWRPECIDGFCGGEPIRPDEFYQRVMADRFCDDRESVPDGFTCD
ncbi:MAG: hypothetical protein AAF436_14355 [Myxococcota bacterium]